MSTTTTNYSLVKPAGSDRISIAVIDADLDLIDAALKTTADSLESLFSASVKDYAATGDGSTDDTNCVQAAIAACPSGGCLYFPPGTYKITETLAITQPVVIAGPGATIHMTATGTPGLTITASDVKITGLILEGPRTPGAVAYNASEVAIKPTGTSAAVPIERLTVTDCEIYGWGKAGIWSTYTNDVCYRNNYIHDVGYSGITALSTIGGSILNNHISTVAPGTSLNAYGVALTRNSTASLTTDPRSQDLIVAFNRVADIPLWEGLDTHGGQNISFIGNKVTNCKYGIAVVPCPAGGGVYFSAIDCDVIGNYVNSTVTDGSCQSGIGVSGMPSYPASGSNIVGNTVIGHGTDATMGNGNLLFHDVENLTITGNRITQGCPNNIAIVNTVSNFICQGNVCEDPWTEQQSYASNIHLTSHPADGYVGGNAFHAGSKSATHVNDYGVRIEYGSANSVVVTPAPNSNAGVSTPIWAASGALRAPATYQSWVL